MADIKNVKLFKGQGKNAEFLEAFETMPNDKKLKEFIRQHHGQGFYYITYHDGKKPQKKIIVIDRLSGDGKVFNPVQFQGQKDDSSEYLFQLLSNDIKNMRDKIDSIDLKTNTIIDLLKEALEDVEELQEGEEGEQSAIGEILKNMKL
jgi:hypothetical protein